VGKGLILFSFKLLARSYSLDDLERMREVMTRLEQMFPILEPHRITDAFSLLIATILSQNTNDRNSSRAFLNLMKSYEIKPVVLANLRPEEIRPLIKYAGLQDIRSKRIIAISKTILHKFSGDLNPVLKLPLLKARHILLSLDGVGPKTADILLNFLGGRAVMPIDTNIFRVINRLNFVKGRNYEKTRLTLETLIPSEKLKEMHFLLIQFGRKICKPRNPTCSTCPLNSLCDYPKTRDMVTQ
jgi:endonuclease-3